MGQILRSEYIPSLVRLSGTQVQLPASASSPTILTIGGKQYVLKSPITCNPASVGIGGIDTGSPAAHTVLYHYAVVSGGVVGLIASLSAVAPTGYVASRFVGSFNRNYANVYGGLLHNYEMELQPIFASVYTDAPTFTPVLANSTQSTCIYTTAAEDSHLCFDLTTHKFYAPITKSYSASGCVGLSGTYANNGKITATIRADSFGNLATEGQVNSASSAQHSVSVAMMSRPVTQGSGLFMTVTPVAWTTIVAAGISNENNFTVKG